MKVENIGSAEVDIGKLAVEYKNQGGDVDAFVANAVAPIQGNATSEQPKDVVLYGFGRIGRMKNTIVGASGENIYPEDIETIINSNQFVVESLVIEEDGFLVAKIILDLEQIEKNIAHLKTAIDEKKEQYQEWKAHFTKELNSKLNRTSQINRVDIMDEPFEKTASQKIKRFLYTKTKKK
jgi:long-subunit acyl-CoA synthetase (AMP-forming)